MTVSKLRSLQLTLTYNQLTDEELDGRRLIGVVSGDIEISAPNIGRVMPRHNDGAPVWVRVGRTDHHAHIVSAVVKGGRSGSEPASYVVRWSNETVEEVESSAVRPDDGGRRQSQSAKIDRSGANGVGFNGSRSGRRQNGVVSGDSRELVPGAMPSHHKEGAPVWVKVGRTDHHAHIVSAVVKGGRSGSEPSSYVVRWSSNETVEEVKSSAVRPDEGGRGRTRRPTAAICQETNRHMLCADDGGGGGKQPAKRESVQLAAKSDSRPVAKKAKRSVKESFPADDCESGSAGDGELPNARPVKKRSGEDPPRKGKDMRQTEKSETAKPSITDEIRNAPTQKKSSAMIVELGDEHTRCLICCDKFSTDVNSDDDEVRRHLPVLSSSPRCDHW